MANHEGYIFLLPSGHYLTRSSYIGHGSYRYRMGISEFIDCAWVHPTDQINVQKSLNDWSSVVAQIEESEAVKTAVTAKHITEWLIALPAKSFQRVELMPMELKNES